MKLRMWEEGGGDGRWLWVIKVVDVVKVKMMVILKEEKEFGGGDLR